MPLERPPPPLIAFNVVVAPVEGSVRTSSLADILPPVLFVGLVVTIVMSPSIPASPETSNFLAGVLPIPKRPEASMTASSVPTLLVKCMPIAAAPF